MRGIGLGKTRNCEEDGSSEMDINMKNMVETGLKKQDRIENDKKTERRNLRDNERLEKRDRGERKSRSRGERQKGLHPETVVKRINENHPVCRLELPY